MPTGKRQVSFAFNSTSIRLLCGLLCFVFYTASINAAPKLSGRVTGQVVRVYDGDTLTLQIAGADHQIRFEHIDTPEVSPKQPHGIEARDALRALVDGKTVDV